MPGCDYRLPASLSGRHFGDRYHDSHRKPSRRRRAELGSTRKWKIWKSGHVSQSIIEPHNLISSVHVLLFTQFFFTMTSTTKAPTYLHLDDIRKHSVEDDCWIIVHSKVYDVSTFHKEHPGGSGIIMRYAGRDATASYDEIHAPGILEDTLPPERFLGFVHEAELKSLIEETSIKNPKATKEIPSSTGYSKPDLHRLISVRDFEDVARNIFTAKAFAFYSSAATDLVTHAMNSDFYRRILIRPRILKNVKTVNIRRTIMGCESSTPFFVSPAAMAKLAHPEGELALARGCGAENIIQIVGFETYRHK